MRIPHMEKRIQDYEQVNQGIYMISEILRYIFVERMSLNETADMMGMSGQQLKDRIMTLEQMGYIRKANTTVSHECGSCASCNACSTDFGTVQYMITDKGSKLIEKT